MDTNFGAGGGNVSNGSMARSGKAYLATSSSTLAVVSSGRQDR